MILPRTRVARVAWVCTLLFTACDGPGPPEVLDGAAKSPEAGPPRPDHATVVRVDPGSGEILAVFPTGPDPFDLVVAADHVWTHNFGDGTLTHIDPSTGTAESVDVGEVVGIASDGTNLWVARDGNVLTELDGVTGEEVASFRLAEPGLFALRDAGFPGIGGGSLWLTVPPRPGHPEELWRIDPGSGEVLATIPLGGDANPLFVHGRYVWVVTKDDQALARIDMRTNEALEVDVGPYPWSLAASGGSLWIGHHVSPRVIRFDARTLQPSAQLEFETNPRGLASGGGSLWVATEDGLHAIDPTNNEVSRVVEFGPFPADTGPIGVAFLDGSVWISIE